MGLAIAAAGAALVVGGLIALAVRSRREARSPSRRAREVSRAISRLVDHPDRVAAEESVRNKILAAAGIAAGTAVARRLVDRLIAPDADAAARPVERRLGLDPIARLSVGSPRPDGGAAARARRPAVTAPGPGAPCTPVA